MAPIQSVSLQTMTVKFPETSNQSSKLLLKNRAYGRPLIVSMCADGSTDTKQITTTLCTCYQGFGAFVPMSKHVSII